MSNSTTSNVKINLAIKNAEVSLRMEGLYASKEARRDCFLVLEGKMTDEQYMVNVRRRYAKYMNQELTYGEV